ncbi:MAG: F0F1 ATP synthase subunit delta [Candidatus Nanopelagicales bacterium]
MLAASNSSLSAVLKMADAVSGNTAVEVASGVLAAAQIIETETQLRNVLTDGGRTPASRSKLASDLFTNQIPTEAVNLVKETVAMKWSSGADLVDVLEQAGYRIMFGAAESDQVLDRVEEEVFRFARLVAQSGELQMGLTNPAYESAAKAKLIENLLAGKAHPYSVKVLSHVAANLRGRRTDRVFDEVADLAAARRSKLRAKIRVAISLDDKQRDRLTKVLTKLYNKAVHLDEVIDPNVVGGIEIKIADDVIDGTIAGRLRQARHQVAG